MDIKLLKFELRRKRHFFRWLFPVLKEYLIIISLFFIGYRASTWYVWLLVILLLGSRQHALGILGHDVAHYLAAKNRIVNDIAGKLLCFFPLMIGLDGYRRFHFRHHRWTNIEGKDPELTHKLCRIPKTKRQIAFCFLMDLLGFGVPDLIIALKNIGKAGMEDRFGPVLFWLVTGTILIYNGYWLCIVIWFLALHTSFWGFFRLRAWTEHVGADHTHIITANWWQRFLITPYNTWYHHEHHESPSIPFYQLPILRDKSKHPLTINHLYRTFTAKK